MPVIQLQYNTSVMKRDGSPYDYADATVHSNGSCKYVLPYYSSEQIQLTKYSPLIWTYHQWYIMLLWNFCFTIDYQWHGIQAVWLFVRKGSQFEQQDSKHVTKKFRKHNIYLLSASSSAQVSAGRYSIQNHRYAFTMTSSQTVWLRKIWKLCVLPRNYATSTVYLQ